MGSRLQTITDKQLAFTVFCFLQASPLFQTLLFSRAAQESWLVMLLPIIIGLLAVLVILRLCEMNGGGLELSGICRSVLGNTAGTAVSLTYLVYFVLRLCVDVAQFGGFVSTNMLQRTPVLVITCFFIIGAMLCARRGPKALCAMSFLFAVLITVYVVASAFLLGKGLDFDNLLPIFSLSQGSYVKAVLSSAAEPFANIAVFLMLFDENKSTSVERRKAVIFGYVASSAVLAISVLRDNALFGPLSEFITAPSFQAARLISIGEVLSRLEIVFAVIFVTTMLFKTAITLYCISKLFSRIVRCGESEGFVVPFGILTCGLSVILFRSREHMEEWSFGALPFYDWLFEIILPIMLLLACVIKGALKEKRAKKKGLATSERSYTSNRGLAPNIDGKKLYAATLVVAVAVTGTVFFLLLFFNYQLPSPLGPAKRLAEAILDALPFE